MALRGGWRDIDFTRTDGLYVRSRMLMPLLVRLTDSEIEATDGVVPQILNRVEDGRCVPEEISSRWLLIDDEALLPDLHVDPIHGDI